MGDTSTEALLFDLGGVVFDIDFNRAFEHWADSAGVPVETLGRLHGIDHWYERHERGEIDGAQYFDALGESLGITLSHEQFVDGWNAIFKEEFSATVDLLRRLSPRIPVYAFSNTNAIHKRFWERRYAGALSAFARVFVSCDLGSRKPEAEAFRRVSAAMGVEPDRVLFFDDTRENVDGARRVGMRAIHVRGFEDIRANVADLAP